MISPDGSELLHARCRIYSQILDSSCDGLWGRVALQSPNYVHLTVYLPALEHRCFQ